MDSSKILDILQNGNVVIPLYLLKKIKEFKLDMDVFVFLMYLHHLGNKSLFDVNRFSNDLNLSVEEIMNYISVLTDKGLITIDVSPNDKGFMEEVFSLDSFYNKWKMLIIGDIEDTTEDKDASSIYDYMEHKFGRTLSGSIDYEIVHSWLDNNYNEDLIKKAVDEAVSNGVSTLKYIDRILYEWAKKGITTVEDLNKSNSSSSDNEDLKSLDEDIDLGIMDWDWFDNEEDE